MDPGAGVDRPEGHAKQDDNDEAPARVLAVPMGQGKQVKGLMASIAPEYLPASQSWHAPALVDCVKGLYVPAGQGLQE